MHSTLENHVKCDQMPTTTKEKKVTRNAVETAQQENALQVSTSTGCHRPVSFSSRGPLGLLFQLPTVPLRETR